VVAHRVDDLQVTRLDRAWLRPSITVAAHYHRTVVTKYRVEAAHRHL